MTEPYQRQMQTQIVNQSIEVVRRRIDELGTREPTIQQQGTERILVQVPGLKDPQQLKTILSTTAKMTFRLVDTQSNVQNAVQGRVPADDELLYEDGPTGQPAVPYLVQRRVMVSGDRLRNASSGFDQRNGQPVVNFTFDTRGATDFGNVTKANVGRPFAIVLDNKVISAPVIREPIIGGRARSPETSRCRPQTISPCCSTRRSAREADRDRGAHGRGGARRRLGAGRQARLHRRSRRRRRLHGRDIGLFGFFAAVALAVNMVLLVAVLTALQATLTLPGIAGMVLTMGMAVDANVLIYERIREEMAAGKSIIASIDAGFRRAIATITDTNMTHVLAAAILYAIGTGPVRGFAVTLGIGVITSYFTAVMVTRLMVATWAHHRRPKTLTL